MTEDRMWKIKGNLIAKVCSLRGKGYLTKYISFSNFLEKIINEQTEYDKFFKKEILQ